MPRLISSDEDVFREFHKFASRGDANSVRNLARADPRVFKDLMFFFDAAKEYSTEILQLFIRGGAINIDELDKNGYSALKFAVFYGNIKNVEALLKGGANPNVDTLITKSLSPRNNNPIAMLKLLLRYGADINRPLTHLPDENLMTEVLDSGDEQLISFVRENGGIAPGEIKKGRNAVGHKAAAKVAGRKKPAKERKFEIYSEQVISHFSSIYGEPVDGSIQEIVSGSNFPLHVHFIPYSSKRKTALLFTVGMGLKKIMIPRGETSFEYAELAISLPRDWPSIHKAVTTQKFGWPIQWMFRVANYVHEEKNWLDSWSVIGNSKKPLARGVKFVAWGSHVFESNDSVIHLANGKTIGIFFLLPLFKEEYMFERKHGVEALIAKFGRRGLPVTIDLQRRNVCESSKKK